MSSHVLNLSCMRCGSPLNSLNITFVSPCPHLLHTNYPPSELEASSIRQAITQAKNDQEHLTREIAQLQATMDTLCNQRDTVDTFISEHKVVLVPARRILPEILSEIFLWCFADDKLTSAEDVPIVMGQVCSYWRSVAISTPRLWSSLDLYINGLNAQPSAWLMNTALTRSGACPLTIELAMTSTGWGEYADLCLDTISNHSRHWKCMSFRLPSPALRKLSVVKHSLPVLEALDVWEANSDPYTVSDAFEVAPPRLRCLRTDMSPSVLKVPMEQLEYFYCWGELRQKDCLEWLRRCPNLIECRVIIEVSDTGLPLSLPAHLPRLVKLGIVKADDEDMVDLEDLFNALVTPVLNDLHIEYERRHSIQWTQSCFISFLSRSGCALRKLDLTDTPITDVQLIEILLLLPSLVELIIHRFGLAYCPVTNTLLQQLIYRPPKLRSLPLLSPRLQFITFDGHFVVDGRILGDMVASRWRMHGRMGIDDPTPEIARLKSVKWARCCDLDEETRVRLEKYRDEGLKLDICSLPLEDEY